MLKLKRRPTAPGQMLRDMWLKDRGITVTAMAAALKISRRRMNDILNDGARVDPVIAGRLGVVLGTSAQLWVNLQAAVDAWDAEKEAKSWKPGARFPAAAE